MSGLSDELKTFGVENPRDIPEEPVVADGAVGVEGEVVEGEVVEESVDEEPVIEDTVSRAEFNRLAVQHRKQTEHLENIYAAAEKQQQMFSPAEPHIDIPDPDENLTGYIVGSLEEVKHNERTRQQAEREAAAWDQYRKEVDEAGNAARQYRSVIGEEKYDSALEHLMKVAYDEALEMHGHQATPANIQKGLLAEFEKTCRDVHQRGESVGEFLVNMSKRRGWRPPASTDKGDGSGGDARKAVQAARKRAGKSISNVPGSGAPATGRSEIKQLLDASPDEYRALTRGKKGKIDWKQALADAGHGLNDQEG
jgi:hypothetical protein